MTKNIPLPTWIPLAIAVGLTGNTAAKPLEPKSTGHGDPYNPAGSLFVTPTVVREGVKPDMRWGIDYPQSILDLFVIGGTGTLLTTNSKTEKLGVRVVGLSHRSGDQDLPVALWVRVGGWKASWQLLFYGPKSDVDPSALLYNETIHDGTIVDFAARGGSPSGDWYPDYSTIQHSQHVEVTVSGDPAPTEVIAGGVEGYMTQFLTEENNILLGPREILYLYELEPAALGSEAFDLQDLAVVVSYTKNNNGHGNNLDGVDVSNPGQGSGGPTGSKDPSGTIDDEGKIKKKK